MRILRGVVQLAAGAVAAGTGCGGEPRAGALDTSFPATGVSRAAMAAAADAADDAEHADDEAAPLRPLQSPAAQEALARMSLADFPAYLHGNETTDLSAPHAILAHVDDAPLPAELTEHSGLDDLLLVLNGQAEHLRMSGEVVLCRAEDSNGATAQEVPAVLVELALSAQDAADALADAVGQVAQGQDMFIPAAAVSANHTVVEKLSRTDAKRFSDAYVHEQLSTLKRAKKTLKQAFQLNPRYADVLERAARRLNKAFLLFDFVREKAAAAAADPLEGIRFGSEFVAQASDLLHSGSKKEASAGEKVAAAQPAASGDPVPEGQVVQPDDVETKAHAEAEKKARDEAKKSRRVHFSLATEPAAAAPAAPDAPENLASRDAGPL